MAELSKLSDGSLSVKTDKKEVKLVADKKLSKEESEALQDILKAKETITEETKRLLEDFVQKDYGSEYERLKINIADLRKKLKTSTSGNVFGKDLFFAVVEFQKTNGLNVTGIPDKETLNAINSQTKEQQNETITGLNKQTLESKKKEISKIIEDHGSYELGEWRDINKEVAALFGITVSDENSLIAFGKQFQQVIGSKEKDGKIGPRTIRLYTGKSIHKASHISGKEQSGHQLQGKDSTRRISKNPEQISKKIDNVILSINNEIESTKNFINSAKKEIGKGNIVSWTEKAFKYAVTLGDYSKTGEQEKYEEAIQNSIIMLFRSLQNLKKEIISLQKKGGDKQKIEEYIKKYNECVQKTKSLNNGKEINGLSFWDASWNSTKEAGQNIVNGESLNAIKGFGKGLGKGVVEGLKGVVHMLAHPIETAKGLGKAIEMAWTLTYGQALGSVEQKAQARAISEKVAEHIAKFGELPPEQMAEKIGEITMMIIAGDKGIRAVGKVANVSAKISKAYISGYRGAEVAINAAGKAVKVAPHKAGRAAAAEVFNKAVIQDGKAAILREVDAAKHPIDFIAKRRIAIRKGTNEAIKQDSKITELQGEIERFKKQKQVEGLTRSEKNRINKEIKVRENEIKVRKTQLESEVTQKVETEMREKHSSSEKISKAKKEAKTLQKELTKLEKKNAKILKQLEPYERRKATGKSYGEKGYEKLQKSLEENSNKIKEIRTKQAELSEILDEGVKNRRVQMKENQNQYYSDAENNGHLVKENQALESEISAIKDEIISGNKLLSEKSKSFLTKDIKELPFGKNISEAISKVLEKGKGIVPEQIEFVSAKLGKIQESYSRIKNTSIMTAGSELFSDIATNIRNMRDFIKTKEFSLLPKGVQKSIKNSLQKIYTEMTELKNKIKDNFTKSKKSESKGTNVNEEGDFLGLEKANERLKGKIEGDIPDSKQAKLSENKNIAIKRENISVEYLNNIKGQLGSESQRLFNNPNIPKPEYIINAEGREFLISGLIKSNGREFVLGYTKINGQYEPRFFYFSQSGGNWHCAPGIEASGRFSKAEFMGASYEKGTLISPEISKHFVDIKQYSIKGKFDDIWMSEVGTIDNVAFGNRYGNEFKIDRLCSDNRPFALIKELYQGSTDDVINYIKNLQVNPALKGNFPGGFSKGPNFTHKYLGEIETVIGKTTYNGEVAEVIIARAKNNNPDLFWVEDIKLVNSNINSHGIKTTTFNGGPLTTKPLEYNHQVPNSVFQKGVTYEEYVDIRPFIQENPIIRRFKELNGLESFKIAA